MHSNRGRGNRGARGRGRGRQPANEHQWFKVMVPFGARMTKDEFVSIIQNESGGLQFNPVSVSLAQLDFSIILHEVCKVYRSIQRL